MSEENNVETVPVEPVEVQQEQPAFDHKAVEAELLRQANARADDPTETAATAYSMYVPHFKRLLPTMSTRALRRILNYVVLYPLEQDSIKSATETEKQFMQLTNSLIEAKFIMIMHSFSQNAQAMYDAQNTELTEEESAEIQKEFDKVTTPVVE